MISLRYGIAAAALLVLLSACRTAAPDPDHIFGHRFEEDPPDGRMTLEYTPEDPALVYYYYPAFVSDVTVRSTVLSPDTLDATQAALVEALIFGAVPDPCFEAHRIEQHRTGHLVYLRLEIRRPQGAVCPPLAMRYRFYLQLEGQFEPGHYTLVMNTERYPFQIRTPAR